MARRLKRSAALDATFNAIEEVARLEETLEQAYDTVLRCADLLRPSDEESDDE